MMCVFVHVITVCLYSYRVADVNRVTEYRAVVKIQSWFRGIRLRSYLKYVTQGIIYYTIMYILINYYIHVLGSLYSSLKSTRRMYM